MFWNKATSSPVPGSSLIQSLDSTIIHPDIVQQPPLDFMPYGFPLIHTICFVTCYSEDEEGLRTTLDSLSTTDYPNSHKLLMVVCDGLIKGSGNDKTTPEIALGMMDDFVTPPDEVNLTPMWQWHQALKDTIWPRYMRVSTNMTILQFHQKINNVSQSLQL